MHLVESLKSRQCYLKNKCVLGQINHQGFLLVLCFQSFQLKTGESGLQLKVLQSWMINLHMSVPAFILHTVIGSIVLI